MIQNFSTILQKDVLLVIDDISGKRPKGVDKKEQDIKVGHAALRIFGALAMAVGIIFAVGALPYFAAAPVGALLKMAFGASIYALGHDIFVMSKNITDQMKPAKAAVETAKSFISNIFSYVTGEKDIDDAPSQPVTNGTFFRPLWDEAIIRLATMQANKG